MAPLLYKPASFDPVADFTPIGIAVRYPMYLVTSPKLPAATFKEFIALARSQPGKLNYASAGVGGIGYLVSALFVKTAGLDAVASASLRDDIAALASREGATIFLTTHNMAEA